MNRMGCWFCTAVALTAMLWGPRISSAQSPQIGQAEVKIGGQPAVLSSPSAFGFLLLHRGEQAQVALMGRSPRMVVSVREGQEVEVVIAIEGIRGELTVSARAIVGRIGNPSYGDGTGPAEVSLARRRAGVAGHWSRDIGPVGGWHAIVGRIGNPSYGDRADQGAFEDPGFLRRRRGGGPLAGGAGPNWRSLAGRADPCSRRQSRAIPAVGAAAAPQDDRADAYRMGLAHAGRHRDRAPPRAPTPPRSGRRSTAATG